MYVVSHRVQHERVCEVLVCVRVVTERDRDARVTLVTCTTTITTHALYPTVSTLSTFFGRQR